MIKNRLVLALLVAVLLFVSINFSASLREKVLSFSLFIKHSVFEIKHRLVDEAHSLISQKQRIAELEKALASCQETATLSVAFAAKLNHFLKESKLQQYDPDLQLVQALSYVKLGDYSMMWLDFPDYNRSKVYGLLYKGYAAGIVDSKEGRPVARLLSNKKMVFSVEIGKQKHLGVLFGGRNFLSVKYIPTYAQIKIGDQVITGGNDNIFYEGVKVGEIVHVQMTTLYKTALVKPYADVKDPEFFYAVDVYTPGVNERNTTLFSDALK